MKTQTDSLINLIEGNTSSVVLDHAFTLDGQKGVDKLEAAIVSAGLTANQSTFYNLAVRSVHLLGYERVTVSVNKETDIAEVKDETTGCIIIRCRNFSKDDSKLLAVFNEKEYPAYNAYQCEVPHYLQLVNYLNRHGEVDREQGLDFVEPYIYNARKQNTLQASVIAANKVQGVFRLLNSKAVELNFLLGVDLVIKGQLDQGAYLTTILGNIMDLAKPNN